LITNKKFGLQLGAVQICIGVFLLFFYENLPYALILAGATMMLLAFFKPTFLKPIKVLWLGFGLVLHKIISPFVLFLLFFFLITPISLLMKTFGKSVVRLKPDPGENSYWMSSNRTVNAVYRADQDQ
jgi:hypothetical protein